jgi:hypothetical protein
MCLSMLEDLSPGLPTAGVLDQFILAIEDTYPKYARSIRRDLRSERKPILDAVIKELNVESRREDPVKTALAGNNQQQGDSNNKQGSGGRGQGRGRHRGGRGGGQQPAPPTTTTSPPPTTPAPTQSNDRPCGPTPLGYCTQCKREHRGPNELCWITFHHLIPPPYEGEAGLRRRCQDQRLVHQHCRFLHVRAAAAAAATAIASYRS